ncbi:lipopolysaccharide transport periplasmic protein LptA [Agaribacter flavus]|uniref:Lipopolysaccharide transport periplasmic protein LptA n=1 Tax=Agaribacter flavus TaxID=1902781 RepID=A0ABV7FS77_9ALTE
MFKASIFRNRYCIKTTSKVALSALLFAVFTAAVAQEADEQSDSEETQHNIATDFQQTIKIRSRNQLLNGKSKTSVLVDEVLILQGSLKITADRVEMNAAAGKGKEVISAIGQAATYQQKLEDGSLVSARASSIKYDVATREISLTGNAQISQNDSTVSADSIAYNMTEQKIIASTDGNSEKTVSTVISVGDFDNSEDKGNEK